LVASGKLKSRSGVIEGGRERVAFALDAKNVSLQLCANIMIIILAEAFLFSFPS